MKRFLPNSELFLNCATIFIFAEILWVNWPLAAKRVKPSCTKQEGGPLAPPAISKKLSHAFQAVSLLPIFTRVGNPMVSRISKKGFGSNSSTLTIVPVSHVPFAINIAAATGGTPAV